MRAFDEDQNFYLDKYSGEFERGFLAILKNGFVKNKTK
jgi:hypothetical protein